MIRSPYQTLDIIGSAHHRNMRLLTDTALIAERYRGQVDAGLCHKRIRQCQRNIENIRVMAHKYYAKNTVTFSR